WEQESQKEYFIDIAKGKEIGHRLADLVDEKTTAVITINHLTKSQYDGRGEKRSRSMGDIWVKDFQIYHPVNVKTGIVGHEGQPNMVSLKKILDAIINRCIDSYYLLMVKFEISSKISSSVYFVDMLNYIDFLSFDSGPGQVMLNAKKFIENYETYKKPNLEIKQKVEQLMVLYKNAEYRLRQNRKRVFSMYKSKVDLFLESDEIVVTTETQSALLLK
ncbi:MAG: hypothetical protein V1833_07145, partial [Elusimicrobiota bacterium]